MWLTSRTSVATRTAAASTPATITCSGLMLTMSRSPAAFLRTPKKLEKTAPNTCRNPAGRGPVPSGGGAWGSLGVIVKPLCRNPRHHSTADNPAGGIHPGIARVYRGAVNEIALEPQAEEKPDEHNALETRVSARPDRRIARRRLPGHGHEADDAEEPL